MSAVMNMPETLDDQGEGRWQQFLIGGVIVALLVMLVWWGINSMSHSSSGPKRQTVKIAVLPDTPPPPPPPKPDKPRSPRSKS